MAQPPIKIGLYAYVCEETWEALIGASRGHLCDGTTFLYYYVLVGLSDIRSAYIRNCNYVKSRL